MQTRVSRFLRVALLALGVASLGGCAVVKPYQRERLAHPAMSFGDAPGDGDDAHMLESREGSAGGHGAVGGGCGCN